MWFDKNLKIDIITSFYITKNKSRMNELLKALDKNLHNKYINNIHLFLDDKKCVHFLKNKFNELFYLKIKICNIGKQPLYSDLFNYSNKLKNKICMIINSDIWLYSIDNHYIFNKLQENKGRTVFSITRHEHDFSCPLIENYQGSHDAFIFISPIDKEIIKQIKHKQNVWGSENVLLYELNKINYKLYNPCKQIIIIHEHKSEIRNENRKRINWGDINGDGIFSIRSHIVKPYNDK
mgnify:FL=1|tara:strand:- start:256 stop:963 length:708 start_codon:yes stop_codon:yes gene_type:complete